MNNSCPRCKKNSVEIKGYCKNCYRVLYQQRQKELSEKYLEDIRKYPKKVVPRQLQRLSVEKLIKEFDRL